MKGKPTEVLHGKFYQSDSKIVLKTIKILNKKNK